MWALICQAFVVQVSGRIRETVLTIGFNTDLSGLGRAIRSSRLTPGGSWSVILWLCLYRGRGLWIRGLAQAPTVSPQSHTPRLGASFGAINQTVTMQIILTFALLTITVVAVTTATGILMMTALRTFMTCVQWTFKTVANRTVLVSTHWTIMLDNLEVLMMVPWGALMMAAVETIMTVTIGTPIMAAGRAFLPVTVWEERCRVPLLLLCAHWGAVMLLSQSAVGGTLRGAGWWSPWTLNQRCTNISICPKLSNEGIAKLLSITSLNYHTCIYFSVILKMFHFDGQKWHRNKCDLSQSM